MSSVWHIFLIEVFFHITLILNIYFKITNIYLWRNVVCLFYFVLFILMRSIELGCFRSHSWSLFRKRGALALFHGVWTCNVIFFEYWMISSLKIKLNCSWKFRRNWNVLLVLLERPWWTRLMEFIWWDLDSECGRYWFLSDFCHWKFK